MAMIKEHNYVPNNSARNLKRSDSKSIAVLVKGISNPFFSSMIKIMEEEIQKKKYSLVLYHVESYEDEVDVAFELVKEKRLRGIVFLGGYFSHTEEKLSKLKVPFILSTIGINPENISKKAYSSVSVDDIAESYKVVDYLCKLGHTKIATITATSGDMSIGKLRLKGYKQALLANNIPLNQNLIRNMKDEIEEYSMNNGYEVTKELIASGTEFTALFAISDSLAIGACKAILDVGKRIPEDYSVVGFDGIEIHAAHGYLISEFLSPFTNKRVDEYGGCFDNRVRFLDEIYAAVRKEVGEEFPLIVRISGNEYLLGGRTEAESFELARHCEEIGFDTIHVSNSMYASAPIDQIIAPMYTKHALNMDISEQVKKLVSIPVIVTNRINDPKMADTLLKMGKADFIGMGRGSLADPHLPEKAKAGKFDSIHYCIGCLQGCEQKLLEGTSLTCLINPRVGREYENDMEQVGKVKKVMVIGAGPGGLTAAYTAANRGHNVTIFEKKNDLGGQFKSAAYPLGKGELATFVSSMGKALKDLNVQIHLNTEVTEELLQNEKPDSIIVATGAVPLIPNIKGIDSDKVVTAEDVLLGNYDVKAGSVVVCGGGEVGGETAHFLTQTVRDITLVEMQKDILNDMMIMTKICLTGYLHESGVKIMTEAKVNEINEEGVVYTNASGEKITLPADLVVSAFGYKSYNPLEEVAKKYCSEVYVVGGAIKASSALCATRDGYEAGLAV